MERERTWSFRADPWTILCVVGFVAVFGALSIDSCNKRDIAKACVAAGSSWDGRNCTGRTQ